MEIRCGAERVSVPREILERYDVPGPRYTSYPTAPEWSDSFGPEDLAEALEASNETRRALSIYMHLPFCERLCLFCGCNVVIRRSHDQAAPYLERLKREVDLAARWLTPSRPVRQFHWGGGTPTYFSPAQLEDLFGHVRDRFRFAADAEIGVEVDPRVTTPEHLRTLRRLGFNRLSLGIQDIDPRVQATVRRIQPWEDTRALYDRARDEGFRSINVDLIYGLPHQNRGSFARTLDAVIAAAPDRVATYSYAHVPWLKKQQGSFARHLPSPGEKFGLFASALERFSEAGYRFIGFDHFARPDDELCVAQEQRTLTRNFQGYSTHGETDLVAFGMSAISGLGSAYAQNRRDLASWQARIDAGELPTMRGLWLDEDDLVRREVITRLLCHGRLRKREITEQLGMDFDVAFAPELERLETLERDGLVHLDAEEISVTLLGRIFLRVVGMTFDRYLRREEAGRTLYSRTV